MVGQSFARGGKRIRTPFSSSTPIPPQSLALAPTVQCEGNRAASTFPLETLSVVNLIFLASTQNFFSLRPPRSFSEDSLSTVLSPPYLVCFPSSPPPGQPGRYRCRHLGSGRRGGGLTSWGGASGGARRRAPPYKPASP